MTDSLYTKSLPAQGGAFGPEQLSVVTNYALPDREGVRTKPSFTKALCEMIHPDQGNSWNTLRCRRPAKCFPKILQ